MAHLHDTPEPRSEQDAAAGRGARVRASCPRYQDEGLAVITYPARKKFSAKKNWPVTARLTREQVERLSDRDAEKLNVGGLTGKPSGGLYDGDHDVPEAVAAARVFLPHTDRIHGRPSNPWSHYWYRCQDVPDHETVSWQFADDGKQTKYVELRGGSETSASQTMIPPSLHPNGEELVWEADGEPATLPYAELHRSVVKVALAALFARHWPAEGARHDASLALTGGLVRSTDWSDDEVDLFTTTVARIAGDDEYAQRASAERTRQRLFEKQQVTGWTTLADLLPNGDKVVAKAREWLEIFSAERSEDESADEDDRKGKDDHRKRSTQADNAERELAGVLAPLLGRRGRDRRQEDDTGGDTGTGADAPPEGLHCTVPITELFHTEDLEPYATVERDGHHETYAVGGRDLNRYLRWLFFKVTDRHLSKDDADILMERMEPRALFEGQTRALATRIVQTTPDEIWLDLGEPKTRRAVRIWPQGWIIVDDPPIKFVRKRGMLPIPAPEHPHTGETLGTLLRPYVNVPADPPPGPDGTVKPGRDWVLVVAWLLAALRPQGPFAVLMFKGPPGSGKSTVARVLRGLIDPNEVGLDSEPRELRDVAIAARSTWCMAYDNLSRLSQKMSDTFCRLATGGGFRTRQLYTDEEERLFSFLRPVLLTGVGEVITAPDLLDRTLGISLVRVPAAQRKAEGRFWADFAQDAPRILGALLDVVASALTQFPAVQADTSLPLPRMADFGQWGIAVERAMGWPAGTFADAYSDTRRDASDVALDGSAITLPLFEWLNGRREHNKSRRWEGTMSELLRELERELDSMPESSYGKTKPAGWPRSPNAFSHDIQGLSPHLGEIHVVFERIPSRVRLYRITDDRPEPDATDREERLRYRLRVTADHHRNV